MGFVADHNMALPIRVGTSGRTGSRRGRRDDSGVCGRSELVGMDWRDEYIQAVTQKSGSDAQRGIFGNGNGGCKGRKIDRWNWTWCELYNVKNRRMSAEKIPGCIGCFAFP